MLFMPTQITLYEEMSALSAQMAEAARATDWDKLVSLERAVAVLREALRKDEDNSNLSESEREMKTRLIQRILEDDAEVRRHTEPKMEQVRQFLGSAARKNRVERAYGAS